MIGIEGALNSFSASVVDRLMKAIWAAAMWLLRTAFALMDGIGGFRDAAGLVDTSGRPAPGAPFFALWPTLTWIGGAVAVGLFLWQLTLTMVRGGTGFWRVAAGPAAYGVATALTLGGAAALIGVSEGLTVLLLERGLAADNFRTILDHPSLGFSDSPELDSSLDATARAVLLGMIALFGVLPAAVGFLLQMLFRQAVIIVLIATVPITAAGLLASTTATWFWRSLRWMLAAILMKPALALVLVIGVSMLSGPTGIGGLLAGAGVLLISLFCPLALFRLLAFVERGPQLLSGRTAAVSGPGAAMPGGPADGHAERVNTARFDAATPGGGPGAAAWTGFPREPGRAGAHPAAAATARRGRLDATLDATRIGHGPDSPPVGSGPPVPAGQPGTAPVGTGEPVGHRPRRPRPGAAVRQGRDVAQPAASDAAAPGAGRALAPRPPAAGPRPAPPPHGVVRPHPPAEQPRRVRIPTPEPDRPVPADTATNGRPR